MTSIRPIAVRNRVAGPDEQSRLVLGIRENGDLLVANADNTLSWHPVEDLVVTRIFFDAMETWHCDFHTKQE